MYARFLAAIAGLALFATPSCADDSSASLGAGGLVLTQNADIRMASEDLRLSPKAVSVRYEFANDSARDIDTIVAFPLPDVDLYEFYESPLGTVKDQTPNFVGFALTVDGKPVAATPEEHAVYKGRDVTALVKAAGLPINIAGTDLVAKLGKLSKAQRDALAKADLVEIDGDDVHPKWTAQTKFWWRQHFPAGKTVIIEHRYQPVTGQSFFSGLTLTDKDEGSYYDKNYCFDAPTRAAVKAKIAAIKNPDGSEALLNAYATDFVLVTARNWKGPIGKFHLTIDKLKPANLISLCWDGDIKKTGPTTFEFTAASFAPARDVKLLVLETPPKQ